MRQRDMGMNGRKREGGEKRGRKGDRDGRVESTDLRHAAAHEDVLYHGRVDA